MPTKLTANAKAGGCASKLSPSILDAALSTVPRWTNDRVLVGYDKSDDAGVYDLTQDGGTPLAIVQTVDFFTPIVDDPYTFGAVAAANALSDVYAMGGRPITALSLVVYPQKAPIEDLQAILTGGADKIRESGAVILGGHSITDDAIKFGYAVTGLIDPSRVLTNSGAVPGDVLLFSKRLGTGVIATAWKNGTAREADMNGAIEQMLTLNRGVCEAMATFRVHACTDVTGFGLLGHAREMAMGSNVTLNIEASCLRFLAGAMEYSEAGAHSGGLKNNRAFAASCVHFHSNLTPAREALLYDPQTSGGLLLSMPETDADGLMAQRPELYKIGRISERKTKPIEVLA